MGAGAVGLADDKDCKKLRDDDKIDQCRLNQAVELQKPAWCDDIISGSVRARCFGSLGRALHRDDLCAKAEDQGVVADCLTDLALLRRDVKACGLIRDVYKEARCVTKVADRLRAFELCGKIKVRQQRADCQRELAKSTKNPGVCAQLDLWRERDACYAMLVDDLGLDLSLCERIESGELRKVCYHRAAPRDVRVCERVGGPESRARAACYEQSMRRLRSPADCDAIRDAYQADKCLNYMAQETRTVSLCERVKDWVLRDECFSRFAFDHPENCFKIQSRPRRRRCATSNWRRSKNVEICPLLREPARTECRTQLGVHGALKGK